MQTNNKCSPWRITFETNPGICNLNCIMCEQHSPYNKIKEKKGTLPIECITDIIRKASKHGLKEIIPSTMGEPLLYSDFLKIIECIKGLPVKINLTTNGTFPVYGADRWGELILPYSTDTKISVNGASAKTAESIMKGLNFRQQQKNISQYIHQRDIVRNSGINAPSVTIQTTYMAANLTEIPDILKSAIEMDADRFKGHHMWITHENLKDQSLRNDPKLISRWNETVDLLHNIAENLPRPSGDRIRLENVFRLNDEGKPLQDENNGFMCPFVGNEAWIQSDGSFSPCCAPKSIRDNFGHFGNVFESDFIEIWNSKKYQEFRNYAGNSGYCNDCNMKIPLISGEKQK
ncbi:radical SAM protein [Methanoplanus limicola]|uniref:Radical SAM domain protein n=1 Tax=Methanoplanus limicola DSM 2279 TaxID=937775 RepID=H1Z054_9EURY|nr:radical SAM protein [Methanoplanus limicola]EHQ36146.1 Radical SAM domain protein [Methanoplanus limicola DSM 2279]